MKTLSPYQEEGVQFLAQRNFALLADDMGLGKTAQLISAADYIGAQNILVICPAVARINWQREFSEFSIYSRNFKVCTTLSDEITDHCIVSYDYATENFELLKGIPWDLVICDESHFIKEPEAKRTVRIYGKNGIIRVADRLWCSSGTPAPNHAGELWPLLYTFGKTALSHEDFIHRFCKTRPTFYGGKRGIKIDGTKAEAFPEIKSMLSTVMLRRLKKDVLKELPPVSFETVYVEGTSLPETIAFDLSIIKREEGYLVEAMAIAGDQLSFVLERIGSSVSVLRRYVGLQKVKSVAEMVKRELSDNAYEKIVIFAVHTDVIAHLKSELSDFGAVVINGKTPQKDRQDAIDSFQNDKATRVFIGNIKAAGTAITLTAAHQVLFVEKTWSPGEIAQAIDRVNRRGQTLPVTVRSAVLADSLDEKVDAVLTRKTRELTEIFNTEK